MDNLSELPLGTVLNAPLQFKVNDDTMVIYQKDGDPNYGITYLESYTTVEETRSGITVLCNSPTVTMADSLGMSFCVTARCQAIGDRSFMFMVAAVLKAQEEEI